MMKKGLKIIGLSGMILALSVGSIACQKNMSTENTVVNETAMEFVEDTDSEKKLETETDKESKETSEKKTKETDKENKKTSEKKAKETETQNKKISKKKTEEKSDSNKKAETEVKETVDGNQGSTAKPQRPSKPSRPAESEAVKPAETQPVRPAETQPSKPAETQHNHTWVEMTKQVHHEAVGHYETVVIQAAWDEPIYESHNFCNVCLNLDLGSADNAIIHSVETGHGYHSERVQVGTQHHDAVTEQKWVEDKAAWTETVVTGYKCSSCGETKK